MLCLYQHLCLTIVGITFWSLSASCSSSDTLTVQISDGEILGSQFVSSWTNKTVYAFRGIPYASPPTGDLRFKHPVPPTKWNTTKDCTEFRSGCMQNNEPLSNEDCLFLNVYSPELNPAGALAPVYIWIHGGAFMVGAGSLYGPDPMVAEGVVVVTINYRLGALGFLTLGTNDVPGNAALFDQALAMKWVQKEISKFGGDPNRVTIGGESAGSMMIHLHYISSVSKGLFQAAIGESGTSLRVMFPDNAPKIGLQFAKSVNCSSADISVTQQCLRNLSTDVLLKAQSLLEVSVIDEVRDYISYWVPVLDNYSDNPFLPAPPEELIAQGQGSAVPFLMGTNRDEGTVSFAHGGISGVNQSINDLVENMRYLVPSEVLAVSSDSSLQDKEQKIKSQYFDGKDPSMSTVLGYIKLFGDFTFDYPTAVSAQYFYNKSSVFLYRFVFDGDFRRLTTDDYDQQLQSSFVAHGDDLGYLFLISGCNQSNTDPNTREMKTFNRMVKLWTNFMKYGTPTPSPDSLLQNVSWTPVQNNSFHYLEISDNLTMVQSDYQAQLVQFWDNIYSVPSSASTLLASLSCLIVITITLLFNQRLFL